MRNFFSLIAVFAVVATSIIGCSKADSLTEESEAKIIKIRFNAQSDPLTKTYFGEKTDAGYPTVWTTNQKMYININLTTNYYKRVDVVPNATGSSASFDTQFTDVPEGEKVFYAVTPSSAVNYFWAEPKYIVVDIPGTQTPTMTSVDEAAHILGATSESFTEIPSDVNLRFKHLVSYGRFTLKNFSNDVTITSVEISSESDYIAGSVTYPVGAYITDNKPIIINPVNLSSVSNSEKVFWFAMRPVNLEGKKLTFTVNTNAGKYVKTLKFKTGTGNFLSGQVASFVVNMSGIEPIVPTYRLVTDYSELTEGSEVIIAPQSADYAMSIENWSYPHRRMEAVTKDADGNIVNPSDNVQTFVLGKGASDNTVTFKNINGGFADKYLGALNTTSPDDYNHAQNWTYFYNEVSFSSDYSSSFSVHLEDNNDANITIANAVSRYKYVSYDGPNRQFKMDNAYLAKYGVSIYKLEGTGEGGDQLIIPTPEIHFTSGVNVPVNTGGMIYVGNTQYLPATGGTYTVDVEVLYPKDGGYFQNVIQINGGGTTTISGLTVSWNETKTQLTVTLPQNESSSGRSGYMDIEYSYKEDGRWINIKKRLYIAQSGKNIK